jgi:FMN phosphatase YigB (HAD superfamily)
MQIRAVIFDIYKTVLEVGPPPSDADQRWQELLQRSIPEGALTGLDQFAADCAAVIDRKHAKARATGIAWPEIYWPEVVREAFPALQQLTFEALEEFLFQHAQLQRTVRVMPGAGDVLALLKQQCVRMGVASNSQPYTLREIDAALKEVRLARSLFNSELCFWSFMAGFSKPDPHVFRWLGRKLKLIGIAPEETLMVGDRLDNDIQPAAAAGWRTWHLQSPAGSSPGGNWEELKAFLSERIF